MLGCSSVAAVEEVAGGVVFRYYWVACLRARSVTGGTRGGGALCDAGAGFGGAADGTECVAGDTQKPEKVCG